MGPPRLSENDAYKDALELAAEQVQEYFSLQTTPTAEFLRKHILDSKEVCGPTIAEGETRRCEMVFQFNSAAVDEMAQIEREVRMTSRMQILARGLAVAVAALFAIAGYVRLDEWSKGYYSGLLKAVAVLAVIGIGIAAWIR